MTDVAHGILALAADGSFTYTPTGDYTGDDSFTYTANDGTAESNLATVSLTVGPAPVDPTPDPSATPAPSVDPTPSADPTPAPSTEPSVAPSAEPTAMPSPTAASRATGLQGAEALEFGASIAAENALPGNPPSEWDVSGAGDLSIQGFATDISVNRGETIDFKIDTTATAYDIKIYRLGYYRGNGARLVAYDLGGHGHQSAGMPHVCHRDWRRVDHQRQAARLRQLVASRRAGRCRPTRSRASTSPGRPAPTTAAPATSRSSSGTTPATPT